MFDPLFHDVDTLLELVTRAVVSADQLNVIGSAIQQHVHASEAIERYVLDLWESTDDPRRFGIRIDGVDMDKLILAGASPRGMSALLKAARVVAWLANRSHLVPDDIHSVLPAALGHRIFFTPLYELRRSEVSGAFVDQMMQRIASP